MGVVASSHNDKNIGVQETLISAIKSIHWKLALEQQVQLLLSI